MKNYFFNFLFGKKRLTNKASANIWWIIIGAVIALVVLIVMILIFTEKSANLEGGLLDCGSKGGKCLGAGECSSNQYNGTVASAFECSDGKVCCFTFHKDKNN